MAMREENGRCRVACDFCPSSAPECEYYSGAEEIARKEGYRSIILDHQWPAWRQYKWLCRDCCLRVTVSHMESGI